MIELLVALAVVGAAAIGGAFWLRRLAPTMAPLEPAEGCRKGVSLFVLGFAVTHLAAATILVTLDIPGDEITLESRLEIQALANVIAIWVVTMLAHGRSGGLASLGVRRRPHAASPAAVASAGWLAFLPVFFVVTWLNDLVLGWIGVEAGLQDVVQMLVEDESAARSPWVWITTIALIPFAEEFLFRGALYGGLRARLPNEAAIAISALAFGLVHGATALAPLAALGALFAWLYDRTGNLAAPTIAHGLHNGLTMWYVTSLPPPTG